MPQLAVADFSTGAGPSVSPAGDERRTATAPLLERESELERLAHQLEVSAGGTGQMVLLEGEAGIGKTSLLCAVAERAREMGFSVLSGRGAELERGFAHGLVRQLYEPLVRGASAARRRRLLRGAAALAAPVVASSGVRADGRDAADAAFAVNHGLYWLTVELSDERPLLLAVDDAHWADRATLLFLDYLGRRLDELAVLVVCTLRPAEPGSPHELLAALRGLPVVEVLRPALLSEEGSRRLIRRITGKLPSAEFTRSCHEATGGNPFLLGEVLQALAAEDVEPDAAAASRVRTLGPGSISHGVLGRLAALWPEALELARAVAVLDTDADLRHVARVAGLDQHQALVAADALSAARVLAPGRPLRFLHPIIRRAVHNDMPPGRLAADHARAARILHAEDADPERAAVHLLPSEPAGDAWVVEQLRAAAARAMGRGDPQPACAFLRRALSEPPPPQERATLLLELGRAARLAGEHDAFDLLAEALERATDIATRVQAAEELGLALAFFGQLERGLDILEAAARAVGADRDAQLRLETDFLIVSAWSDSTAQRAERRIEQLLPEVSGRTRAERSLLAAAALHRANGAHGSKDQNLDLAERAAAENLIVTEGSSIGVPWIGPAGIFVFYDRLDRTYEILDAALANGQRRGSSTELTTAWAMRAFVARVPGDLSDAEESAARAEATAPAFGTFLIYRLASVLSRVLTEQGRESDAEEVLTRYGVAEGACAPLSSARTLLIARAHVHVAGSRSKQALADAREAARRSAERDTTYILAGLCWSTALALHAARAPPEEVIAEAQRELRVAQRFASPSVEGLAMLVLGIVEGGEGALGRFTEAVKRLEGSPRRLDYARALIELGSALRRTNRRAHARTPLERGMDLSHRCGAQPLAERAREELRLCGARPRKLAMSGVDSLTAAERRVSRMAAEGRSNTEIAQALFVTRKTVETHLGHIYRKLDIGSRDELSAALQQAPPAST